MAVQLRLESSLPERISPDEGCFSAATHPKRPSQVIWTSKREISNQDVQDIVQKVLREGRAIQLNLNPREPFRMSDRDLAHRVSIGDVCPEGEVVYAIYEESATDVINAWSKSASTSIQEVGENGVALIRKAAKTGCVSLVQWLYKKDPRLIKSIDKKKNTLLHDAAFGGSLDLVQWLNQQDLSLVTHSNYYNLNVMHIAACEGHVAIVKWLQQEFPKLVHMRDKKQYTPFHLAAFKGRTLVVQRLCAKDSSLIRKYGDDALQIASSQKYYNLQQWLIQMIDAISYNHIHAAVGGYYTVI